MKVITLWQPWASFIALGWKTIETRTHDRFFNLTGETIGIHAGNTWDKDWEELASAYMDPNQIRYTQNELNFAFLVGELKGKIICTAKVRATGWLNDTKSKEALIDCGYQSHEKPTKFGLYLVDVLRIAPISAKGKQGIWNYDGEIVYV